MRSTEKTVVGPIYSPQCPTTPMSGPHGKQPVSLLLPRLKSKSADKLTTQSLTLAKQRSLARSSYSVKTVSLLSMAPHPDIALLSWVRGVHLRPQHNSPRRACAQVNRFLWFMAQAPKTVLSTLLLSKPSKWAASVAHRWLCSSTLCLSVSLLPRSVSGLK